MRRWILLLLLVLVAWCAWAALTLPPASIALRLPAPAAGEPPVVRGAYHVHSRASDGTGTVEEIAAAARRAGLQFVITTDHGNAYRRAAPPAYRDGVLCIEAVEISTNGGHYAAVGMSPPPYPLGGDARDVVEDVARLGGFGIAAHPDSSKPELRWVDWDAPFDALEWFSADSQWRDGRRWRLLPTLLQYPWRPSESVAALFNRPAGLLRRWDELTARRRVVSLAAADAHARLGLGGKSDPYDDLFYVKLPSYDAVFGAFSIRAELREPLSGDPAHDARVVIEAMRSGHVYTVFDSLAGPGALTFTAESGGEVAHQGDALAIGGAVRLHAATNAPPGATITLLRNGEVLRRVAGSRLEWTETRPGAYRVEAQLAGAPGDPPLPWMLGNPVYVGLPPADTRGDALPPATARLVWPAQSWHIEKDAQSAGEFATADAQGVIRHTLRWELGRGVSSPFVALVTPDVGAMHDASRLAFRASSSSPMRMSVQVRLVDGAVERRWQRSVYLSAEPREITVTFSDMRVAGTGAREPFAPARIHTLLFVVDSVNARPGDRGVLWVEGLRTER